MLYYYYFQIILIFCFWHSKQQLYLPVTPKVLLSVVLHSWFSLLSLHFLSTCLRITILACEIQVWLYLRFRNHLFIVYHWSFSQLPVLPKYMAKLLDFRRVRICFFTEFFLDYLFWKILIICSMVKPICKKLFILVDTEGSSFNLCSSTFTYLWRANWCALCS